MKAVQIIGDQVLARAMTDTMRRTILIVLRDRPMTQTQLAEELGLSKAALNHHLKILKHHNLVSIVRKEVESHGIVQKFFASNSYLQLYDFSSLPRDIISYFYPSRLESERGIISMLSLNNQSLTRDHRLTSYIAKNLPAYLIEAAMPYVDVDVDYGDEAVIYEIYVNAVKALLSEKLKKL